MADNTETDEAISVETECLVTHLPKRLRINFRAHFSLAAATVASRELYGIPNGVTPQLVPQELKPSPAHERPPFLVLGSASEGFGFLSESL